MMKIKSQFYFTAAISVVMVVLVGMTFLVFDLHLKDLRQQHQEIEELTTSVMQLRSLTDEFRLLKSKRAQSQWWIKYNSLGSTLEVLEAQARGPDEVSIIEAQLDLHRNILPLFSQLSPSPVAFSNHGMRDDLGVRERHLNIQISTETQRMIGNAQRLVAMSYERVSKAQRYESWVVMGTICLMAALIFLNSFMLRRRVITPIERLRKGTEIISRGDLSHKVGTTSNDELGELSRAFDTMTRKMNSALENEKDFSALQRKFISLVSHEFRTPLSIIDGAAQRLIRSKTELAPEVVQEKTEKIRAAVGRMIDLIENTLYAARLEEGVIAMHQEPMDMAGMLRDLSALHGEVSPNYDITVDVDGLPQSITADEKLLNIVFTNLLSNAIKFSPNEGAVEIKGWTEGKFAVISVTDHGVGIPQDELAKMFSRFFRARTAEGIKGTGIGLGVSREFTELHGGDIALASREGEGSTFTVRLPIGGKDQ